MHFKDLRLGMHVVMRDGEYNYSVKLLTPFQVCLMDLATGKLFVLDAYGPMLPHLQPI